MFSKLKYITYKNLKTAITSIIRIQYFDKNPILIGGVGRSGTSLISAILDAHPEIKCFPWETNTFERERKYKRSTLNKYRNLSRLYFLLLRENIDQSARRWCEKTPRNLTKLDEIFEEFGKEVKIILMIRDGRDVMTSFHPQKENEYYINPERWLKDTRLTLKYFNHNQVFVLPYESLINNFEYSIKKLMKFLDSPMDDKLFNYVKHSNIQSHGAFHGNKLKTITNKSIEKWKKPEHKKRMEEFLSTPGVQEFQDKIIEYRNLFEKDI